MTSDQCGSFECSYLLTLPHQAGAFLESCFYLQPLTFQQVRSIHTFSRADELGWMFLCFSFNCSFHVCIIFLHALLQAQLRAFIPEMLKYSTGRGKPGWGKESCKPVWWPEDIPWANVRSDVRTEEQKQRVSELLMKFGAVPRLPKCHIQHWYFKPLTHKKTHQLF